MAQKSPAEAARELSIWLSSILLLTHANGNGEHDVATIHALSLMHEHGGSHSHGHSLNMDAVSGADDEAQLLIRASRAICDYFCFSLQIHMMYWYKML